MRLITSVLIIISILTTICIINHTGIDFYSIFAWVFGGPILTAMVYNMTSGGALHGGYKD